MKYTKFSLLACITLALASCGDSNKAPAANTETSSTTSSVEQLIVSEKPADAQTIAQVRSSFEVGQKVTFEGKVMGHKDPFVAGRAMVVLGDPSKLTSCDLKDCDQCPTPWDVCCDDPDDIKKFTATVQVVDAKGAPLKQGIKGLKGIAELSTLTITGTIAEGSNENNLLINASSIYLHPSS